MSKPKLLIITLIFSATLTAGLVFAAKNVYATNSLISRVKGKIVLQVEKNGEAWYVNPGDSKKYYLGLPDDAFDVMKKLGIGITDADLSKMPVGLIADSNTDSDKDGLSDDLEKALGTDQNKSDTDGDGYGDKTELEKNYNPDGTGQLKYDYSFTKLNEGKIFLQVESNGQAWYVNPSDQKRYFLNRPIDAFNIMRSFGLGITDADLERITAGSVGGQSTSSAQGTSSDAVKDFSSPYGILLTGMISSSDLSVNAGSMNDLGADWIRLSGVSGLIWDRTEKNKGTYDWSMMDSAVSVFSSKEINILVTVSFSNNAYGDEMGYMPSDLDAFSEFLSRAVERYDGDGKDDASGSPKVSAWQIGNEIDVRVMWKDTPENYAKLMKVSYSAIKESDAGAKTVLAGMAGLNGKSTYESIIKNLSGGKYFDVFDIHWHAMNGGSYREHLGTNGGSPEKFDDYIDGAKQILSENGYGSSEIWITEMSASDAVPNGMTEKTQAIDLIKRYVYSMARGAGKIFWGTLTENSNFAGMSGNTNYFNTQGLINNAQNDGESSKKLAYYAYKKMAEVLGDGWKTIETIQESGGIYVYKIESGNGTVYVAWNDNSASKTVAIKDIGFKSADIIDALPKYDKGGDVVDYASAFDEQTRQAGGGTLELQLGDEPVFIVENK